MGRVGSAYDNALAESFIATLKTELLYRRSWPRRESAQTAIFEYLVTISELRSADSRSQHRYQGAHLEGATYPSTAGPRAEARRAPADCSSPTSDLCY